MKQIKLLVALVAALMFSNLMFAVKPFSGSADDFAKYKLQQLNKMLVLTDSQKVIVEKKAREYGVKLLNSDSITYQVFFPQYKQEYKMALDSILTKDQKELLTQKELERRNKAISAISKSKNK